MVIALVGASQGHNILVDHHGTVLQPVASQDLLFRNRQPIQPFSALGTSQTTPFTNTRQSAIIKNLY